MTRWTGLKVLDLGAGTGNLSYLCLTLGASVVGLDPSERMLLQARARARSLSENGVECGGVGSEAQEHRPTLEFHVASGPFLKIPYPDSTGVWAMGGVIFENAATQSETRRAYPWLDDNEYYPRIDFLHSTFS